MIWLIQIFYFPFSQVPWYLIAKTRGFPTLTLAQIVAIYPDILHKTVLANTLVLNVPDVISISIYLKLVFKLRHASVQPEPPEDLVGAEDYAGIWMGDQHSMNNLGEAGSSTAASTPPLPPLPLPPSNLNSEHDVKSVLKVLKWHALSSMVDVTLVLSSLTFCSEIGKAAASLFQVFCYYYIPYFVIKKNFKQLNGIGTFLRNLCV